MRNVFLALSALALAELMSSCANEPPGAAAAATRPADAHALIERSIPANVPDRAGWAADMYAAFTALNLPPSHENVCAVAAVIQQESGFQVDPVVPGLGKIARREIDRRAEHAGVPLPIVHGVLQLSSSSGRSYSERIDRAKTEKELSDIFEDFTGSVPLGLRLFAGWNPIRTRGPMQVNVVFAESFAAARPYPYPVKVSVADELFTRRGSLYFGTAHLLAYPAPYDRYLYRFADFNAGQYASRNAAFQNALSSASGLAVTPDGALLPHGSEPPSAGSTEQAAQALSQRLGLADSAIHGALLQGKTQDFERTALYRQVFVLAERMRGGSLPRASIPRIKLEGPKLHRTLTTEWYAHRVDERFKRCLKN